jgi:hypothetical protein
MSKFIDRLKQASLAVPEPIGFKAARSASVKPKMLLVASLAEANNKSLADYVAGADAGLITISELSSGVSTLKKASQAVADIPWGGWLVNIGGSQIEKIVGAGADFIVFPTATALTMVQNEAVGKILEVEASLSEGLLRAIDELPVDAVLIGGERKESLTWYHLMLFQRFAALLTKPLLAAVPPTVTANELKALWEAGVNGAIVAVEAGQPAEVISKLRQTIDKLAFPSPRKRRKIEALLPYVSPEEETVEEEEGE